MPYSQTLPPPFPGVSGSTLTVDLFLRSPAVVQRAVENLAYQGFIADVIFAGGPQATGGAVQYDQVTANDIFLARDVQEITPGAEFPVLTDTAPTPKLAPVTKWGGRVEITDEARDRNRRDVVRRELTKLVNTVVRKVEAVSIAALEAAPIQTLAGADWGTTTTDVFAHLANAQQLAEAFEMGYNLDTALINPLQEVDLITRKEIRDAMSEASREAIVRNRNVGRIMGFDFIKSYRVPAGQAYLLQRGVIGAVSDEVPLRTITYREDSKETNWVQASRRLVPFITDPKAVVKLTGI